MNTYNMDKMYNSYSNDRERMQNTIKDLKQENKQLKEKIDKLYSFMGSNNFNEKFENNNNAVYIKAKIKNIIGWTMNENEFEILKGEINNEEL